MTERHSINDVLRDAMLAHRTGRLVEAEAGYHEVLRRRPAEPRVLYFLGLLQFHRGDREGGIERVLHSLRGDPGNARAWNDLGGMFIALGRTADAKDAYRRAAEVAPGSAEGCYNLGISLRNENDFEGAILSLREAITREADSSRANAKARHMAAAMSGQNAPSRASNEYVRQLFDASAESFDAALERLDYRGPPAVAKALSQRAHGKLPMVLDAGCGTGLCGPLIRALCAHLVGVDLSPKMIERARARECYDELVDAELTEFLHRRPGAFDAVVSADTLVYFGALEQVFAAANGSLRDAGWLVFTLEALDPNETDDYTLKVHGRYAHSEDYVRKALAAANFHVDALTPDTFRKERDQDVPGFLVVARKN
jgi:predicted TPR repeat methyltransferase